MLATAWGAGDDARALLAKAHAAYLENRERERYWNWTTTVTRTVIDKQGAVLQEIPSVTIESPIRSDGKRCDALLAWGDGRKPYLADASADQRCKVKEETGEPFQVEALLEARQVRIARRTKDAVVLALRPDKGMDRASDPLKRCIASMEGSIELDASTLFPRRIALKAAGSGCAQRMPVVNHYDSVMVETAVSTLGKGAVVERDYALQRDKTGNRSKDYWACIRSRSVRPLPAGAANLIVWSRRIPIQSAEPGRHIVVDSATTASELTAESVLHVETEPKKDK